MKFGYYIVYGNPKVFGSRDELSKAFKKFAKVLEKYNMKLKFWGHPFGTSEGLVYVMKGKMEDYQSMLLNPDVVEVNPIASGQRTNLVLVE